MKGYRLIEAYYGEKTTQRSVVKLITHINEGLKILDYIQANSITKEAYCIHPILQSDIAFFENRFFNFQGVETAALILTMEYRRVANSYLSKGKKEDFVGFSCPEIREMLIADKVQNYKDFLKYHKNTHPRKEALEHYFQNWFLLLEINYKEIVKCIVT